MSNKLTIFTKPWPAMTPEELADLTASLGLDGVELAIRKGYPVNPDNVTKELPRAAKMFRDRGLGIESIAADPDEKTVAACGEAGIAMIRICVPIDMQLGYAASEKKTRAGFDALLPALRKHRVAIGVQNHCKYMVGSAIGLMHLIEHYDPKEVCAVLDPAHCAIAGEPEVMALDIVWSHLGMVNLKAAVKWRLSGPDEDEARWMVLWTTAQHGGFSWRAFVGALRKMGYAGTICLPAEYSPPSQDGQRMGSEVLPLIKKDIAYLKKLLAEDNSQARR